MTFYANIGYAFKLPGSVVTSGSVVLASAMPMHQLERRDINNRYPHMANRLFDPQLYLSTANPIKSPKVCAKLVSYPWFGVSNIPQYQSSVQSQSNWAAQVERQITSLWPNSTPIDAETIHLGIRECIELQIRKGFEAVILPSPLTTDPTTAYDEELMWLDEGLRIVQEIGTNLPIYATVALADICVRYNQPNENRLLELIADSISAREVDGVYLVLEQGAEPSDTRHCSDVRTLHSMLTLVHYLARDAGLQVVVNFMGAFGLALKAAGAKTWASGWYKSLYRLRLADLGAPGRAYPTYWNYPAILDIHLESDFDRLVSAGYLGMISDDTLATQGLLSAAREGRSVSQVPAWVYRQSNVASAREHFIRSIMRADIAQTVPDDAARVDIVNLWLDQAGSNADVIARNLGSERKTKVQHVNAWLQAFLGYRADHRV